MKTLGILLAVLLVPSVAFSQQDTTSSLDKLLDRYEVQQRQAQSEGDVQSELRKLRNQIIDLRVERDALSKENEYLRNKVQSLQAMETSRDKCLESECVSLDVVENEKILAYVIYSLSMYRMAEVVIESTPHSNVEAHKQAQEIMAGVKSDLDVLGYDTTDMRDYPTLEELLREFRIVQNATKTR